MWPNRAIAVSVIFSAVAASPISPSTSARRGEGVRFADAWQHIYFHGHYTFCGRRIPIDLDAILANWRWKKAKKNSLKLWIRSH